MDGEPHFKDTISLAGWLFAELMLGLAILFFASGAPRRPVVCLTPAATPVPACNPPVQSMVPRTTAEALRQDAANARATSEARGDALAKAGQALRDCQMLLDEAKNRIKDLELDVAAYQTPAAGDASPAATPKDLEGDLAAALVLLAQARQSLKDAELAQQSLEATLLSAEATRDALAATATAVVGSATAVAATESAVAATATAMAATATAAAATESAVAATVTAAAATQEALAVIATAAGDERGTMAAGATVDTWLNSAQAATASAVAITATAAAATRDALAATATAAAATMAAQDETIADTTGDAEELAKDNDDLRAEIDRLNEEIARLNEEMQGLEEQVAELRIRLAGLQLPTPPAIASVTGGTPTPTCERTVVLEKVTFLAIPPEADEAFLRATFFVYQEAGLQAGIVQTFTHVGNDAEIPAGVANSRRINDLLFTIMPEVFVDGVTQAEAFIDVDDERYLSYDIWVYFFSRTAIVCR